MAQLGCLGDQHVRRIGSQGTRPAAIRLFDFSSPFSPRADDQPLPGLVAILGPGRVPASPIAPATRTLGSRSRDQGISAGGARRCAKDGITVAAALDPSWPTDFTWGRERFVEEARTLADPATARRRSCASSTSSRPTAPPTWSWRWCAATTLEQRLKRTRQGSAAGRSIEHPARPLLDGLRAGARDRLPPSRHQAGQHHARCRAAIRP